jgi:peptidoglycan LD-endopeptidase CwlK
VKRRWSVRSLGNLQGIHPHLRAVMEAALDASPVDFIVIEGLRTEERQRQMVREGHSRTMNSRHLTGHAVDLLPIDPADGRGKFEWPLYHQLAPAVKAEAERLGVAITWGGDWTRFRDGPHFELAWHDYPADAPWTPLASHPLPSTPVVGRQPAQSDPQPHWLARLIAALVALFRR